MYVLSFCAITQMRNDDFVIHKDIDDSNVTS